MIRIFKITSIAIIVFLIALTIIGVLAPSKTYFTKTLIIKSPLSVVWRHMIDIDDYPSWQKGISRVELKGGSPLAVNKTLCFYLSDYDSSVFHEEMITALENDRLLTLLRKGINENPLLKEFQTSYSLKRLLDGTTEVSVAVSYSTKSLITKIVNQLYLRMILNNRFEGNLINLRSLCENM